MQRYFIQFSSKKALENLQHDVKFANYEILLTYKAWRIEILRTPGGAENRGKYKIKTRHRCVCVLNYIFYYC